MNSRPIRSVADAASYLDGLINYEREKRWSAKNLGLAPTRALLESVGNPERNISFVHVAGSKGKGSTCLFVEGLLLALGEKVGTFTSPHFVSWVERFRIDGQPVADEILVDAVERIRPHVDRLRNDPALAPSYFVAATVVAMVIFERAGVDRVVLEVGLGGRLDSTNVVSPAVTCVTSIELEHTAILGDTLSAIAKEKAGILKPGVPCVLGALPESAREAVVERARKLGCPLDEEAVDFQIDIEEQTPSQSPVPESPVFRYRASDGFETRAALAVLGAHQVRNAALALTVVRKLGVHSDKEVLRAVTERLSAIMLPGRVEIVHRRPCVVIDSAHTANSAAALAETLGEFRLSPRHLVLSVSEGKNLETILETLLPCFDSVTVTRSETPKSLEPAELESAVRALGFSAVAVVDSAERALLESRQSMDPEGLLCVTGSVYLAGIAHALWSRNRT